MTAILPSMRIGELIGGKYRLVRVLAEGGMGIVYEAHHAVVRRRFAVKFLRPDLAVRREILTRFHREAQAAGALESENIAAAIDFGVLDDGTPYLVMEFLTGESLRSLLDSRVPLSLERATDLGLQACRGMEAAHASGIIHRDLKPENLFVCRREDGTDLVKVLDFGIAKLEQLENNNAATRTGAILGTPAYMSPEQARGEKAVDHRTDVYSLAAILFEMLTGRKPHPGDSNNAILHHISTQPALPLRAVKPELPVPLAAAVERALASDPADRQPSVEAFAAQIAPFAQRRTWPPSRNTHSPFGAPGLPPSADGAEASTVTPARPASPSPRPGRRSVGMGAGPTALLVAATAVVLVTALAGTKRKRADDKTASGDMTPTGRRSTRARALPKDARFFVAAPLAGAVQQIAALIKQRAFRDAARLTAMEATPQGVWFSGGTPEEVRGAVQNLIVHAASGRRVPILVANNIPFRDCAQYSAGGAPNAAAYQAWIDGFAAGIGKGRAVVILEPDSLGIIPYNTGLDGAAEWCKPTIADAQGRPIAAPGASPADRYAQLNHALDSLVAQAPNASVYLDATHAGWLSVGDIASRLVRAGVGRAQGFIVNVDNAQPTPQSIQYGTWISKCIYYATSEPEDAGRLVLYKTCASQFDARGPLAYGDWAAPESWYATNVDHGPRPPSGPSELTHFVIDTSRNGRGPLDVNRFARVPYDQPADVLKGLKAGSWCNPPDAGVGLRPTAQTDLPLVDAYLWVKVPGASDGSCDIAGGARAWDYGRYNPWGIGGEAQSHFDPLWGTVDPAAGEWFAEHALQLAENADPPLEAPGPMVGDASRSNTSADPRVAGTSSEREVLGEARSRPRGLEISPHLGARSMAGQARGVLASKRSEERSPARADERLGPRSEDVAARDERSQSPAVTLRPPQLPPTPNQAQPRADGITFDPHNPYGN